MQRDEPSGRERRRHPRAGIGLRAELAIAGVGAVPAVLRDLSVSGCFLTTTAPVKLGWTVCLSFLIKPRDLCQAEGRVVRAESADGFGVEFAKVNGTLLALVDRLTATSPEQQGWLLEAICDPHIEIGYLRRPDETRPRPATQVPPECPKCGCRIEQPEGEPPPVSCFRCGLTFALWTAEEAVDAARLDDRGEVLWAEVVAGWETVERHDVFLKHCSLAGLLGPAGRRYRQRLDDDPADAMAARMQERVMAMATAAFIRPQAAVPRAVTRNMWFWAVVILFGLGGIAGAGMQMVKSKPPVQAAPPPAPPPPGGPGLAGP
jgi:hypothetical protein